MQTEQVGESGASTQSTAPKIHKIIEWFGLEGALNIL